MRTLRNASQMSPPSHKISRESQIEYESCSMGFLSCPTRPQDRRRLRGQALGSIVFEGLGNIVVVKVKEVEYGGFVSLAF